MEYDIVRSCEVRGMVEGVNRRLNGGWEIQGGPFVTNDRWGNFFYHQAMTRVDVMFAGLAEQASKEYHIHITGQQLQGR